MTDQTHAAANSSSGGMRSSIAGKWSKFSAAEIAALTSKDELIALVQSKYSLDKAAAQKDVEAFANGRQL